MKINIGIGLDNIIFGMSEEEVKNILGNPDKISETESDYERVYYYNDKMLKVKFDREENYKLITIEAFEFSTLMLGVNVINKSKEEIISILEQNSYTNLEYEEYDFFDTIFCEEIWTTFTFEFNRLRSVEFSPLFKDDERVWLNKLR